MLEARADKKRAEVSQGKPRLEALSQLTGMTTATVGELPERMVGHPRWPKGATPGKTVLIYPRGAVNSVRFSIWMGVRVQLRDRPRPFPLSVGMFQRSKVRAELERMGYPTS